MFVFTCDKSYFIFEVFFDVIDKPLDSLRLRTTPNDILVAAIAIPGWISSGVVVNYSLISDWPNKSVFHSRYTDFEVIYVHMFYYLLIRHSLYGKTSKLLTCLQVITLLRFRAHICQCERNGTQEKIEIGKLWRLKGAK